MPDKRRKFQRKVNTKSYRSLFIIAVEGSKTESQYFSMFNTGDSIIQVYCLKGKNKSSPNQVLKRLKDYLKKISLKKGDMAWLVIDKDDWTEEQIKELYLWSKEREQYGLALSNPQFEYWLVLHFDEGHNISSANQCIDRLRKHLPNYNKEVDLRKFTRDSVKLAIHRAQRRDNPPCEDWPREFGQTTVYRLVEHLL